MQENGSKGRCHHEITSKSVTRHTLGNSSFLEHTLIFRVIPAVAAGGNRLGDLWASVPLRAFRFHERLSAQCQRRIGRDLGDAVPRLWQRSPAARDRRKTERMSGVRDPSAACALLLRPPLRRQLEPTLTPAKLHRTCRASRVAGDACVELNELLARLEGELC